MSREKQIDKKAIEEMANVIKLSLDSLGCGNFNFTGEEISTMFAEALYNVGCHKQSEGEWVERTKTTTNAKGMEARYTINFCSACGYEIGTIRYQHKFCPNCGAKMKGGE